MTSPNGYERPAVAGSGTIACGLAACASTLGEVWLLARSDTSAWRAEEEAEKAAAKLEGAVAGHIKVTTDPRSSPAATSSSRRSPRTPTPRASSSHRSPKAAPDADLASTTSSLSISDLGDRAGAADRVFGLHVFNPVPRMELIELCIPEGARDGLGDRARAWCGALDKTAVEVPDTTGFVVNRLLFPYLFDAVRFMEESGMTPAAVDDCMRLGAGHPMGPLKLLDFVGLDVAVAIGESLGDEVGDEAHSAPALIAEMVADGKLGRKSGEGFYDLTPSGGAA